MHSRRVLSVAPLPSGWRAIYRLEGKTVIWRVSDVALVESSHGPPDERRRLVGIVTDGSHTLFADSIPGAGRFVGYAAPAEDPRGILARRELQDSGQGVPSSWFG